MEPEKNGKIFKWKVHNIHCITFKQAKQTGTWPQELRVGYSTDFSLQLIDYLQL